MSEQPIEKKIILARIATGKDGTFGVLIDGNIPFALTLEPPWRDNQKNISCIPGGSYQCDSVNSPRFGYTFSVLHVPDRTHIVFHCGNYTKDTKGCILVGEQFQNDGLLASRDGYKEFMFRLKDYESFSLEIKALIYLLSHFYYYRQRNCVRYF